MKRGAVVGLVIAGVLVLGVGGAVAVSLTNGDTEASEAVSTPTVAASKTPEEAVEAEEVVEEAPAEDSDVAEETEAPGVYMAYSESAVASAQEKSTAILFFHAPWCPQCRSLDVNIESVGVPDGMTIFKVDYDSNQDLRQKYGVTQQTTLVELDSDGNGVATFVPYEDPSLDVALEGLGLTG
ncbi:thioredoxin family protein (plasmid) [Coraliomargarita sp. W4R53]